MAKVFCNNCIIALLAVMIILGEVEATKEVKGNLGKAKSGNLKGRNATMVHNEVRNQTMIDKKEMNTLEKNVLL